ncbi:MAG: hypothetical protein MK008_06055 [Bdellovibrionales bacterium]|nr:hypothetical protein [Bdellovibrionales bacterium]
MNKKIISLLFVFVVIITIVFIKWMSDSRRQSYKQEPHYIARKLLVELYVDLKANYSVSKSYLGVEKKDSFKSIVQKSSYQVTTVKNQFCNDCKIEKDYFKIAVYSNIDDDPTYDVWTIDSNKEIVSLVSDLKK